MEILGQLLLTQEELDFGCLRGVHRPPWILDLEGGTECVSLTVWAVRHLGICCSGSQVEIENCTLLFYLGREF